MGKYIKEPVNVNRIMKQVDNEKLYPMEIEAIKDKTKAARVSEKKVMLSVIPTELIVEELNRRGKTTDTMIDYITRFADYINSVEDPTEREIGIKLFRKAISKGGVLNEMSV